MEAAHVHISQHISKLGAAIPSVSLPAGPTCRPDAPCFKLCYARKGRFMFQNVKTPLERNLMIWKTDPERYEEEVEMAAYFSHWFRWHSSGDIPDDNYFAMMVRSAQHLPGVKFLCFTKRYEIVNKYLDIHQVLPENLSIVLSAWGDWIPENPHNLPMSYIALKKQECEIPEDGHPCSGFCGECVLGNYNCWALKKGESVVFKQH